MIRENLEAPARRVLPERRLYVLLESQIPKGLRVPASRGWTCRNLDLMLREAIGPCWCGRGAAVVLSDIQARRDLRAAGRPVVPALWHEMAGALCHELAHIVGRPPLESELENDPPAERLEVLRSALARAAAEPLPPAMASSVPWADHDGQFIRLVFHIAHRLRAAAGWFAHDESTWVYGLSPGWKYRRALGDEPARVAVPLTGLVAIPPPDAFVELWRADLRRWFGKIESPDDSQTAALRDGITLF